MTDSTPEKLLPESLPLTGRHLIEASAGTGKTFNITRIYLRLLLESKLDVKQILVMTFTRAATEELRGRIAGEIRNALDNWGQFDADDSFFTSLSKQFSIKDIQPVLHHALLHLDEAAIFTIHSFCKRVLTQQAFSSGVSFNMQMQTNTTDIELEAVRDWYRTLSRETDNYKKLTQLWPAPENFYQAFVDILSSTTPIQVQEPQAVINHFKDQKTFCTQYLLEHKQSVFSELIDANKQRDIRAQEWEILIQWLTNSDEKNIFQPMPKEASNVFHGGRFPKKDIDKKQFLIELFRPVKQLKEDANSIESRFLKAQIYQLAAVGIKIIRLKIITAKQTSKLMNYDDLINQLASSLTNEADNKNQLARLIREQYPVALVDEFQDTDPQQYFILNAIYPTDEKCALYMIGDPKQAIYAFRNGDVFTYLSARNDAQQQWIMDTNWRSSTDMVDAYNRLFYGAPLEQAAEDVFGFDIQYQPVNAAGKADQQALLDGKNSAALQLIYFPFNQDYRSVRSKKNEMKQDFCPVIASWCSSEINRLLNQDICIGKKKLQESNIAILVRDKREANYMQDALRHIGYSSVYLSTHDNVFYSEEAAELKLVLKGILELENDQALVAALSTQFFSCDTQQLLALQNPSQDIDSQWESHKEKFFNLREIWFKRGFMAMALKLLHHNYQPAPQFHERSLTNAIQLLELLQQASQQHKQPEQLLNWFGEQINSTIVNAEAELRLESDANLIRIITQHGSKGLEYPIVFIPFATRYKDPARFGNKNIDLFKYHDRDTQLLNYFIGQDKKIIELYKEEAWAETIRLLYVAITRAEHRCYICAAPFANYHLSPLGQTLKLTPEKNSSNTEHKIRENSSNSELYNKLTLLLDTTKQNIHLQQINETDFPTTLPIPTESETPLTAAKFCGRIERNWWLSSFSALTKNLRHGGISTPDRDQDDLVNEFVAEDNLSEFRFKLTKGAATGNLLHDILEHIDFSQPHWQRSLERPLARYNETLDASQVTQLINWLESCLNTQLNSQLLDNLKLNQLNWSDTLRESEFYFPMQQLKTRKLSTLLAKHRGYEKNQENTIKLPGHHTLQGM
ncbi:MAG: UvrD-helicase domain-containing protein, partial [Pseudomonadota bacterium]